MREYEAMIITRPDLAEADLVKMYQKWEGILALDGGEVIKKDVWGVRKLAYPIEKTSRGHYTVYDMATTQASVQELDRVLRLDENVLRSGIFKLSDDVNVEDRKVELQKLAEENAQRAAEALRDRADGDSMSARRGPPGRDFD